MSVVIIIRSWRIRKRFNILDHDRILLLKNSVKIDVLVSIFNKMDNRGWPNDIILEQPLAWQGSDKLFGTGGMAAAAELILKRQIPDQTDPTTSTGTGTN